MRLGIVSRVDSSQAIAVAKKTIGVLRNKIPLVLEKSLAERIGEVGKSTKQMDVDIIICIGGDGTILRTLQHTDKPVFGINVGAVGFLTELEPQDLENGVKKLLSGDYELEERLKLKVLFNQRRLYDCANEAVLHTAQPTKMRSFKIMVNETFVDEIRGDGVIVATPTGSTCYAMSVGSPILDPRVDALVIAPIAAFKPSTRPLVVPAESQVEIKNIGRSSLLVLDGQWRSEISTRDKLLFTASERRAKFIRFDYDFYRRIRERLI